ncbi:LolA family protein [Crassaminicella thermophila]|uniref:LolA family protein n=1 Tax=Crassaminicella thermophila TaxID=2599308 RepID=UPI001A9AF39F|nr:outer-membrane lipoprotein carrier protein LolA [Crassaminicella thermophila]
MIKKVLIGILLMLLIVGCSPKTEQDIFYEAQKKLNKMEGYSCQVEITSIGNKSPQKYIMKQWFKKPNKYKLELIYPENLKGKITISNGNRAWIYHPSIEQTWIMENFSNSKEQNMFLGYFLKNCLNSEKVDICTEELENQKYLVITTEIPGNHIYFHKEKLWLNQESMNPYLLQIFDMKGKLRIEVKYEKFKYNPKLQDDFFQLK